MDYKALAEELVESKHLPINDLTIEQMAALSCPLDKSAVIVAGAGAGKTKLMVERAINLVRGGVAPSKIAIVTFTKKSTEEISNRIKLKFGKKQELPICSTVHALAYGQLRTKNPDLKLSSEEEIKSIGLKLLNENIDLFEDYSLDEFINEINRHREEQDYSSAKGVIASKFNEILEEKSLIDYTKLLELAVVELSGKFKYILVDEAQDISALQNAVLQKLAAPKCKFWFIGDSDQAIYSFRGATTNVLKELAYGCDLSFYLTTNFRCDELILAHANNVIKFNPGRELLDWKAFKTEKGTVEVLNFDTGISELSAVEEWLKENNNRVALARTQAIVEPLKIKGLNALTVHEAKGLEWPEVWIMGCEAALFPHPLGIPEEERRLFYVAMTRAKNKLRMSYCSSRAKTGDKKTRHPSHFLYETQALTKK